MDRVNQSWDSDLTNRIAENVIQIRRFLFRCWLRITFIKSWIYELTSNKGIPSTIKKIYVNNIIKLPQDYITLELLF